MKPPAFTYHRPSGLGEALEVLAETGADGKVLAGGQSLVPMLNMRLAAPAHLVDINRLTELAYLRHDGAAVRVGALARHADLERDTGAAVALPLLGEATRHVAHPAIRNRGTTVGSIAHADPAAEMPGVLALLGGHVELARHGDPADPAAAGTVRRRTVPAAEFFQGPLESAIRPGELAVEAVFPVPPPNTGTAWRQVARRHGDYALCAVGALVTLDEELRIASARVVCVSVGPVPIVLDLTDAVAGRGGATGGHRATGATGGPRATGASGDHEAAGGHRVAGGDSAWDSAGALAAGQVDPEGDIHATAAYRRHLVGVLTARAVRAAAGVAVTAATAAAAGTGARTGSGAEAGTGTTAGATREERAVP